MKLIFLFFLLLTGCQNSSKERVEKRPDNTTHFTGHAMTIDYHVIVARELHENQIADATALINDTFSEIDTVYNKWNPNSELSRLNAAEAMVEIPISHQLEKLLNEVQAIVEISKGHFDPTVEPLQQLWKSKLEKGTIPNSIEIAEIAPAIGWDNIRFENGTFSKSHSQTKLDLGGIAKGLCVDFLIERLNSLGYPDVYVEWGGEIRTSGRHSAERPWTVFISRLGDTDPSHAVTLVALENSAIATSGDYLQNWSIRPPPGHNTPSTITYFHVFDPQTLKPLQASYTSIASASVAAPSCALADGLATAAMAFANLDEAKAWAEEVSTRFPNTTFWLMTREQLGNSP
jgi:FAD:protein FMN transferase